MTYNTSDPLDFIRAHQEKFASQPVGTPAEVVAHGVRQTRGGGREFYARVVTRGETGRVVRSSERTFESQAALDAFVAHPSIKPMHISSTRKNGRMLLEVMNAG